MNNNKYSFDNTGLSDAPLLREAHRTLVKFIKSPANTPDIESIKQILKTNDADGDSDYLLYENIILPQIQLLSEAKDAGVTDAFVAACMVSYPVRNKNIDYASLDPSIRALTQKLVEGIEEYQTALDKTHGLIIEENKNDIDIDESSPFSIIKKEMGRDFVIEEKVFFLSWHIALIKALDTLMGYDEYSLHIVMFYSLAKDMFGGGSNILDQRLDRLMEAIVWSSSAASYSPGFTHD